jgi:glycosyltransferase involved in cell wall biosynthesis
MEKNNPLVSIVIPVHNGEKYLKESIESCINQSYSPIEILVINDASTDGTLEMLKEYGDKIKIITVEKQNGLGNVINIGIREAKGEYIARMDIDDVMYPTRIQEQVEYLESHPDCVALGGQIDIIDENSKITGHREYALEDKDIKKNMFLFMPFAHPAVMLRKSAVEEVGLYPENMPKVEDVKFFFLLSTKGKFANLSTTVLKYRMTFSTESQSNMVDHFKKTNGIRNWAIRELGIRPSVVQYIKWKIETIGVYVFSILPPRLFMRVFEFVRRVFK